MARDVRAAYDQAGKNAAVKGVIPVGETWLRRAGRRRGSRSVRRIDAGKLNLSTHDSYHAARTAITSQAW